LEYAPHCLLNQVSRLKNSPIARHAAVLLAGMVFFVCDVCNESLKKNKVETHSYSCKNCWVLICIDCNKNFTGDTYAAHTSCMTEAQRYEGALYDGKSNKGDVKQAAWIARVHECAAEPSVAANLRGLIERLLGHDNIPRKKAKFENFAKNSLRLHDAKVLAALWGIFEKAAQPAPRPDARADAAKASEGGAPEAAAGAAAKEGACKYLFRPRKRPPGLPVVRTYTLLAQDLPRAHGYRHHLIVVI
jgi:hypothetical protein